jgi:hypothetical protein
MEIKRFKTVVTSNIPLEWTGELIIGNTTSAGLFPAALCEAYRQTQNERYLIAAKQIAEYYN